MSDLLSESLTWPSRHKAPAADRTVGGSRAGSAPSDPNHAPILTRLKHLPLVGVKASFNCGFSQQKMRNLKVKQRRLQFKHQDETWNQTGNNPLNASYPRAARLTRLCTDKNLKNDQKTEEEKEIPPGEISELAC